MVWRRERLRYEGKDYTLPLPAEQGTGLGKPLKMINHPVRDRIPIALAAHRPEERRAHRRAGRGLDADLLPAREGRRRVGRRRWPRARPSATPSSARST